MQEKTAIVSVSSDGKTSHGTVVGAPQTSYGDAIEGCTSHIHACLIFPNSSIYTCRCQRNDREVKRVKQQVVVCDFVAAYPTALKEAMVYHTQYGWVHKRELSILKVALAIWWAPIGANQLPVIEST